MRSKEDTDNSRRVFQSASTSGRYKYDMMPRCPDCGIHMKYIRYGRYCPDCMVRMTKELGKAMLMSEVGEKPTNKPDMSGKMHILNSSLRTRDGK